VGINTRKRALQLNGGGSNGIAERKTRIALPIKRPLSCFKEKKRAWKQKGKRKSAHFPAKKSKKINMKERIEGGA